MALLINQLPRGMYALLCSLFLFTASAQAAAPVGHIDAIKGEVHLLRAGQEIPPAVATPVEVGDHVSTGESSRVRVVFDDGSTLQLGQNAEASIESYVTSANGGVMDGLIDLIEGRGRFIVEKLKRSDAQYRIRTRAVLIGVRGTDILAQANGYVGHVALVEGHVELSRSGSAAQVLLDKGEYALVVGRWPATPQPIPDQWLSDFINDVGTSDGGAHKKKGSGNDGDSSAPADAIQQKMLNQMGSPMVVPQ